MNNHTPDQSRTPELPHAVAWHAGLDCTCDGWISVAASRHGDFTDPLYEDYQLREYGLACVAAAMEQSDSRGWMFARFKRPLLSFIRKHVRFERDPGEASRAGSDVDEAMLSLEVALCASPPPDVQEAEPVAHTEYTPASEAHEAAIDEALGLTRMILRFPAELMASLRSEADEKDVVLAAHIRDRLSQPPSGDAEDARRYRWLRDRGFGFAHDEFSRGISVSRWGYWPYDSDAGHAAVCDAAIDAAMLARGAL